MYDMDDGMLWVYAYCMYRQGGLVDVVGFVHLGMT